MSVVFELIPFYKPESPGLLKQTLETLSYEECRAVDANGNTSLVLCAQHGWDDLADILLKNGSDANATSSAGVTSLSYACGARPVANEALVRLLLACGADPNIPELHYGCCALHYLAATGSQRLCDLMIAKGARAGTKDWYDWTPADYAADAGHDDCAGKLRAAAAVQDSVSVSKPPKKIIEDLEEDLARKRRQIEDQAKDIKRLRGMLKAALNEAEAHRARWRRAEAQLCQPNDARREILHNHHKISRVLVYARLRPALAGTTTTRNVAFEPELDRVYGSGESQAAVFADVKNLVARCCDGFDARVFAYGPSGSGKTYTMIGGGGGGVGGGVVDDEAGILWRSAVEVFRILEERGDDDGSVEVSMFEACRDSLRDLLLEGGAKKRARSLQDLVETIDLGLRTHTSSSHLAISLVVENAKQRGKLTLLDLAAAPEDGESLISRAIGGGGGGARGRNHPLARLFSSSSSDSQTLVIVNCNPDESQATATSVAFAQRCKRLQNQTTQHLKAELSRLKASGVAATSPPPGKLRRPSHHR
ncbi:hypothetical protein CTAYLR_008834 [Chrysophaeum taylorii]|uniref:Kinesin motor domain-containing protein n=1 Tax=Chrysophaeum taylorii TaxID=2483200 RepID=A0AAD7U6Q7_9STRA|nr:hypothetical protein CTAYLR_008834 [Chrysophaeum taylorii]